MELEENQSSLNHCLPTEVREDSVSQVLPSGIISLEQYKSHYYALLALQNREIPRDFYFTIPSKTLKITCVVKVLSSLLTFPVYQCQLKFDNRFIMSAQKGILGKTIISQKEQPKQDQHMLAKLSSNISKDLYKLYEKLDANKMGKTGRTELAVIRYSKESEIMLMPKVDNNTYVKKTISDPQVSFLEDEYRDAHTKVTALKFHRTEFKCDSLKRNYFALKDMMSSPKTNKLVLRRINKEQWEYSFSHPLTAIQAFGMVLSIIDKGCT